MDFVFVSARMEFLSRAKVREGGHSGRAYFPLWKEGVLAQLPPLPEPGAAPTLLSAPAAAGGGEQRAELQPGRRKGRGREAPRAGMLRSAPGGSGSRSTRLSPSGSVAPLPRGCGSSPGESPLALRAAGTVAAGTPGSVSGTAPGDGPALRRQRERAGASACLTPGSGSALGCSWG